MSVTFRPIRVVSAPTPDELAAENRAWGALYEQATKRLVERIEQYAPPEMRSLAVQDLVVVYRFPTKQRKFIEQGDLKLYVPDVYRREELPYSVGLLLCAGAEAMDTLTAHNVFVGDIVRFAPLAGDEETEERVNDAMKIAMEAGKDEAGVLEAVKNARDEEMSKKKLLRLRVEHIHESVDGLDRLFGPKPTMEMVRMQTVEGPMHFVRPIPGALL